MLSKMAAFTLLHNPKLTLTHLAKYELSVHNGFMIPKLALKDLKCCQIYQIKLFIFFVYWFPFLYGPDLDSGIIMEIIGETCHITPDSAHLTAF